MDNVRQLTAAIEREGDGYVATCPELDKEEDTTITVPVPDHAELRMGTLWHSAFCTTGVHA